MDSSTHRPRSSIRLLLFFFRTSKHRVVNDIKVAVFRKETAAILDKVEAALALVLRHDRRAMQVLQRQTNGIFVFGTHGGTYAEWDRDAKMVMLHPEYVSAPVTSTLHLASVLVHEATHAWLENLGFHYALERRRRIEAICFKRQLRFAKHAGGGSELISEIERQLAREPEYLSNEAFRERALNEIERLGMPRRFVIAAERWVNRWRRLKRCLRPVTKGSP